MAGVIARPETDLSGSPEWGSRVFLPGSSPGVRAAAFVIPRVDSLRRSAVFRYRPVGCGPGEFILFRHFAAAMALASGLPSSVRAPAEKECSMVLRKTARIRAGVLEGIDGVAVTAEIDISRGLPGFHLVGLPNAEMRESRERVLSALRNSGQKIPLGKITVNLAPAGVRKTGASCDLAIAVGVLAAGRAIRLGPSQRTGATYLGELSLFGEVRPVRGLLALVSEAAATGCSTVVVPWSQVAEARLLTGLEVVGVRTLAQTVTWWQGGPAPLSAPAPVRSPQDSAEGSESLWTDLAGQALVRKGAMLAAAGGHHCLLIGPPGTGKTRLARTLGRLGAPLAPAEALEVTRIHSATGARPVGGLIEQRPFRAPHHSITRVGLIGGGVALRPGEVTLAHQGLLFLDEVSEFRPAVLDGIREPLADAKVTLVRGSRARTYPARFQLVAAMNPCRCGFLGTDERPCTCSAGEIGRHRARLSGPLLDRIDLFLEVGTWQGDFLTRKDVRSAGGDPRDWREDPCRRDLRRAQAQLRTWRGQSLTERLSADAARFLDQARQPLGLSLRGVQRCVSVAATAAALDGAPIIGRDHVREALEFRQDVLAVK